MHIQIDGYLGKGVRLEKEEEVGILPFFNSLCKVGQGRQRRAPLQVRVPLQHPLQETGPRNPFWAHSDWIGFKVTPGGNAVPPSLVVVSAMPAGARLKAAFCNAPVRRTSNTERVQSSEAAPNMWWNDGDGTSRGSWLCMGVSGPPQRVVGIQTFVCMCMPDAIEREAVKR